MNTKLKALFCTTALFALYGCEPRTPEDDQDEPAFELNAGEDIETAGSALRKGLGGVNGDSDYCNNPAAPCLANAPDNEGDCDNNAQCIGGAGPICGKDNGAKFGTFADFDFCWQTHCENGVQDGDETGINCGGSCGACGVCSGVNGDATFCTSSCQCDPGEGDCDTDVQCTAGNICGVNNGARFGFPSNFDACWPIHCEDNQLNGGETGVDCGGACGPCSGGSLQVLITEIRPDPPGSDDSEWIEITNPFPVPFDISGYTLSDHVAAGVADETVTRWAFPANTTIAAGDSIIVTRFNLMTTAATGGFFNANGFNADFELAQGARNDPNVPNLIPSGGTVLISLSNSGTGDAVLLRAPGGAFADGIEYGSVDRTTVPGTPINYPSSGRSLTRIATTGSSNTSFQGDTTPSPGIYPNP
jgi:hypothetical protein